MNTGLLLSLAVHRPARLPAKVEAARQDCSARPPGSRDASGRRSAADSSPARRVEKYQLSARGGGAPRGGKVQTAEPRRTKMVPPRLCARRGPRPPDPQAPLQRILVLHPLHYLKFAGRGAPGLCFGFPPASLVVHRHAGHTSHPVSSIYNGNARNPSFHARSPHMRKCLCGREDSKGAERADMGPLPRRGERPFLGDQRRRGFVYTRTPVPSSTLVYRHLARERFARPATPMPGKETDAISISDYQMFLARLPQPWPLYTRSPKPPPLPPYCRAPRSNILINANQSQDLPQRSRGPGWFPSP
ncbi:uncharacterized protein LOC113922317 [Zalophus californianus]|uniref:Uncharacterized protein LOC113922317 n=1 Tax=Zalophus californianus TaxID=9704 RepID=A0A6J2D6Z2_ZALCA|nr:uncharacterized protein LOC113922317 [Zalophus californianus]